MARKSPIGRETSDVTRKQESGGVEEVPGREENANGGSSAFATRRRALVGATGAATILALANRPAHAAGAVCTASGFTSYSPDNPSGVQRHGVEGCGGYSPGAWRNPDAGNGAGSRDQWRKAGFFPNPRQEGNSGPVNSFKSSYEEYNDPPGTTFNEAFGFEFSTFDNMTMHDVLLTNSGSLEFHAVAALLNAHYHAATGDFTSYMDPGDVVGLYKASVSGATEYTTVSGNKISLNDFYLKQFFEQTYH